MFKPRQPKLINSMQSCRVEVRENPVRFSGNFSVATAWILLGYSKIFSSQMVIQLSSILCRKSSNELIPLDL